MADKQLKFGVQMDALPSPGMERMVKNYSAMMQKASNVDHMIKGLDKYIKKDKELAKTMAEHSNKALKEKDKLLEQINKKTQRSMDLFKDQARQEKLAAYMAQREVRSQVSDPSFMSSAQGQRYLAERAGVYRSGIQQTALGSMQAGSIIQDNLSQEAQDAIRAQRQQRLMQASVWLQVGGAVANTVSDVYKGPMQLLGNQATKAGLAAQLYNEISNADYTSLRAIGNAGPEEIQKLMEYAGSSTSWGIAGGVLGGLGGIAGGASLIAGGITGSAATAGMGSAAGGLAVAYGASSMVGGARTLVNAGMSGYTDEAGAAMARAARDGIGYYNALDPVAKRQFDMVAGRAKMIQELGALGGGIGQGAWRKLVGGAVGGGMTDQEALPLWMSLRSGIGQAGAEGLIGTAAGSVRNYGIDRGTATSALVGLSGLSGGSSQAEARLEQILHRAFRAGLKDTAAQGMLATALPSLLSGVGGRGSGVGGAAELISGAAMAAGGGVVGMQIALGGAGAQGALFGTSSPVLALSTSQAANIMSVAEKYGLDSYTAQALVAVGNPMQIASAQPGSQIFEMVSRRIGPEKTRQLLSEIRSGAAATTSAFFGGMNESPEARNILMGSVLGISADEVRAGLSIGSGSVGGDVPGRYVMRGTEEQGKLNNLVEFNALNQVAPMLQSLSDPKTIDNLNKLSVAGFAVSQSLASMSKLNPESLRDLPGILREVAEALGLLQFHATRAVRPNTPPPPSVATPPKPGFGPGAGVRRGAAADAAELAREVRGG